MASSALHLAAEKQARAICVFVHGRGQSPEEMQSHVLARLDAPDVAFVLPRAESGSWYDARAIDPLTPGTRTALQAALDQLAGDVAEARAAIGALPLLLAGFSQGACLALEYAFSGLAAPQALAAFTGCRVGVATDDRPRRLAPELPVYLTGSDADPWIPVTAFAEAACELGAGRGRLRADILPGRGHEVSDAEVAMLQNLLQDLAAGASIGMGAAR